MKKYIKLYKEHNGRRVLVDYGVTAQIGRYVRMGYTVEVSDRRDPTYAHLKREFITLWNNLPEAEQVRLGDIPHDDEMSLEEKLMLLKAEIVSRKAPALEQTPEEKPVWRPFFKALGDLVVWQVKSTIKAVFTPIAWGKEAAYA